MYFHNNNDQTIIVVINMGEMINLCIAKYTERMNPFSSAKNVFNRAKTKLGKSLSVSSISITVYELLK